ncbi:ephrin-4-like isoform X2 [Pecten maximus]|uniref:ephrin-4-like isoform X2 n=1 Tax=Pecten maximus TaxID=6579 RepID=UPI00145817AE|nr:ephrin-4-like isoform X2 [Pecten maximus]
MPWISVRECTFLIMVIAVQTLSLYTSSVESAYHHIYWNKTNTLFRRRDSSIHVQLNDNIDVICPDYTDMKESPDKWEYYSIFLVSKEEYESCTIINPKSRNVTQIRNCSTPGEVSQPFTLLILSFQPIPNLPDFAEGKKYYMISTSTGTQNGINNQVNGSCWTRNMRLILDLTVRPTTASPMPHTSHTSPTNRTSSTTSTPHPTTTTKSTTTPTTTKPPTTTTKKPTSKFPDGTPVDPNIVIEAPGGEKNTGIINAGVGQVQASVTVTFVLALVTFVLLLVR